MLTLTFTPRIMCCTASAPVTLKGLSTKAVVDAWKLRKGDVVVRTCPSCAATHRTIVYKRLTAPGSIDYRALFLHTRASAPKGGSNVLNKDFALYGSVADAQVPPALDCLLGCLCVGQSVICMW